MLDITWTHPGLPDILNAIPTATKSILDLGCGRGIIGAMCRIYREPSRMVCIDSFGPSLEFCMRHKFYDESLLRDLTSLPLPFKTKEFEVATCIEVIEHLPKDVGERLLSELERIADRVIITTPTAFFEQHEYDGNPYQKHLSLWTPKELRKRGYAVYGVDGMKIFNRKIKYFSKLLGPFTIPIPELSLSLLAIKETRKHKSW